MYPITYLKLSFKSKKNKNGRLNCREMDILRDFLRKSIDYKNVLELEIRVGHSSENSRKFSSDVGSGLFSKIMAELESNSNWNNVKHEKTVDYFYFRNNARVTVSGGKETCIKKTRLLTHDIVNFEGSAFTVRISLSCEEPCEAELGNEADLSRTKDRMSYWHTNKYDMTWRYDLTIVSTEGRQDQETQDIDEEVSDVTYEIELEMPIVVSSASKLDYCADSTFLKIRDIIKMLD
jgi:hypothetical protein